MATVEFISVVLERWSFGRLLVELYWSFDINTWVNKISRHIPKLRVAQRRERSGM